MTVDILILTDSREQRRSQKKYWYSMKCDLNGELKKTEGKIGRASCRERVLRFVVVWGGGGAGD